jgi:hypothetical protein
MPTGASPQLHALNLSWFKQSGKSSGIAWALRIPSKAGMYGKATIPDRAGQQ